jgi:hypothetical protein
MDVKEAVELAKRHVFELFANEAIINLGLEEVEFDDTDGVWIVTIGFSRPWDRVSGGVGLTALVQAQTVNRSYKVIRIQDLSRRVLSVKNRETKS